MYAPAAVGTCQFYEASMNAPNHGLPADGRRNLDYAFASSNAFDRRHLSLTRLAPGTCRLCQLAKIPAGRVPSSP